MSKSNTCKRHRLFFCTWNNYTDDSIALLMDQEYVKYRYICIGFEEAPTTGTKHMHFGIYFNEAKTKRKLIKLFGDVDIEPAKGTIEEIGDYINKDGDVWESGERPTQGQVSKERLEDIMQNSYENFHLYNQYRKSYNELQRSTPKEHNRRLYIDTSPNMYTVANLNKQAGRTINIYLPDDVEQKWVYDNEDVVIIHVKHSVSVPGWIDPWINGFPIKEKRGYEIHMIDPTIVILWVDNEKMENILKKKYYEYIED